MMIIPTGKYGLFADRENPNLISPKRARAALPILIRYAQKKDTITYRELADAIASKEPLYWTLRRVLDCINTELARVSSDQSWEHEGIPTLTTIVVLQDGGPGEWMAQQMSEQLGLEPTKENYKCYLIKPVHEYEHWKEVIDEIIQSPHW